MERKTMEYRVAQRFHDDPKVSLSFITYPCNGWKATSGLKSADILEVYHNPGCHFFAGHTQIHAVMQHVSVIQGKKEGFRSVLSILAWVWVACPDWEALERPSFGPSHPSEEQIRSRVDGPGRHENRERQQQKKTGFQVFFFFSSLTELMEH